MTALPTSVAGPAIIVVTLLFTCGQSNAQEQGRTYLCSSEIEAGLKYDQSAKEWRALKIEEKEKFILKVRFKRTEKKGSFGGKTEIYNLTITPTGTNLAEDCYAKTFGLRGNPREIEAHADYRLLFCYTAFNQYTFNLKTNRFLSAFGLGYVNGDNNDASPAIAAGKCTEIKLV